MNIFMKSFLTAISVMVVSAGLFLLAQLIIPITLLAGAVAILVLTYGIRLITKSPKSPNLGFFHSEFDHYPTMVTGAIAIAIVFGLQESGVLSYVFIALCIAISTLCYWFFGYKQLAQKQKRSS